MGMGVSSACGRFLAVCYLMAISLTGIAPAALGADEDVVPFSNKFPVEIEIPDHASVYELARLELDIDAVGDRWVRAYVDESEVRLVELMGYAVRRVPNEALRMARLLGADRDSYHNYTELTTALQQIATDHPDITRLVSIGQSVQDRELWFMKITDNPDVEENEPEFKYISTMHGDEPVGTENCLKFIDLLTGNYDLPTPDPDLKRLVDEVEIWILPMMNPDGNTLGSRFNAHGVDLNRDFPDWVNDPYNTPAGREPETQAVMIFSDSMSFDLSANFHTGALVVNYPWDNRAPLTPDDALFINMSEAYSYYNSPMWNSPIFYHGITNGYQWYEIHGGMQDWNYDWMYNMEVTVELCNTKWPPASELPQLWDDNDESMAAYLEYCLRGVRGVVTDQATGEPLAASVSVSSIAWDDRTDPDAGDYHRILDPGTYALTFEAPGYESQVFNDMVVVADSATVLDVQLLPLSDTVLVVDDDSGKRLLEKGKGWEVEHLARDSRSAASDIADDLALLGYEVVQETASATDPATWPGYSLLVWSSGSNSSPVDLSTERRDLLDYAAAGGKLLIEGGELAYDAVSYPGYPNFADSVLHADDWDGDDVGDLNLAAEQSHHPLATDPNLLPATIGITYEGWSSEDAAGPGNGGYLVYETDGKPGYAGVLVYDSSEKQGTSQIVFFAFSYSALTDRPTARDLLKNAVTYLTSETMAVAESPGEPAGLGISGVFPNPFNPATTISFSIPDAARVQLAVYDVRGRFVRTLMDRQMEAGTHRVEWDAKDERGGEVASGVYFCRLTAGGAAHTRKIVKLN